MHWTIFCSRATKPIMIGHLYHGQPLPQWHPQASNIIMPHDWQWMSPSFCTGRASTWNALSSTAIWINSYTCFKAVHMYIFDQVFPDFTRQIWSRCPHNSRVFCTNSVLTLMHIIPVRNLKVWVIHYYIYISRKYQSNYSITFLNRCMISTWTNKDYVSHICIISD